MRRAIRSAGATLLLTASCGGASPSSPPPAPPPAPAEAAAPAPSPAPANPDAGAVESARPALRACYDKARSTNPALGRTTVTVSLRVDESGTVSTVDLEYKHRFDDAAKACLREAALAIKFPAGASRKLEFPLTFDTK